MIHTLNYNKLLSHLKASAKKRNIRFTLTLTDLYDLSLPLTCPLLNIIIEYDAKGYNEFSPSIDRIDSDLGYEPDNIQVLSVKANRAKNNLSEHELKQIAKYYS